MKSGRIKKYIFENWCEIKIIWKTEIWKLEFRKLFENRIFKKLNLGIGTLGNYLKMEVLNIKLKKMEFWRIIRKRKFWKLNLKMIKVWKVKVLKIKLKNWSFEKLN